jgi:MoCo/4Fe-4S cofactor protein with predicted Tat translocation signal
MSRRTPYSQSAPQADGAKVFWKSLEEKADPAGAQKRAEAEFPLGLEEARLAAPAETTGTLVKLRRGKEDKAAHADAAVSRRGFMMFAGASAALAGCARRPVEKIMPYSKAPEHVLPGVPAHYATVRPFRSDAIGLLVESHEGRPTKIEGNPDHPSSMGRTDAWSQAEIYEIYDADRSSTPMKGGRLPGGGGFGSHTPATWPEFDAMLADIARSAQANGGAKLRLLVTPQTSPTFVRLRDAVAAKFPQAKIHVWSPVNESNAREGAKLAFGQAVTVVPAYGQARVIVSVDCDFLGTEPGNVRANREFAQGRAVRGPNDPMSRLYVVEPSFTVTGMNADHRLRLAAQDVEGYLRALAKELADKHGVDLGGLAGAAEVAGVPAPWLTAVAKDLAGARARSVLVCGTRQPPRVHALVHAINAALGNAGHTVRYYPVADLHEPDPAVSLKELADDIDQGKVGTLIVLGGNPAYDAPSDLGFAKKLRAVASSVHLSSHFNETSEACGWHGPRAHELETWGDHRAIDGTVAIQQPLIAPLFGGRSDIELLARLAGEAKTGGHDLVRQTMQGTVAGIRGWNDALKRGVAGAAAKPFGNLAARNTEIASAFGEAQAPAPLGPENLEVTFAPCSRLFDGRYANNPQLLELPDPVSKVTWDNVALISPGTARALGLENRQMVRLSRDGAQPVDIAVWIMPGQADHSIAVHLGWGRLKAGRYGNKHGFDVTPLRTSDALWITRGVKLQKLGSGDIDAIKDRFRPVGMAAAESPFAGRVRPDDPFDVGSTLYKISQTQEHSGMEGRPIAIDATLEQYRANPYFPLSADEVRKDKNLHGEVIGVRGTGSPDPSVLPLWNKVDYSKVLKWGMGIDLTTCTGCNACVVACNIENNIPAVGKEQVERGREMHWIRIDRYFVGLDENNPEVVFQPMACVHCEEAPCENVCPVNATAHSPEGLNDMAYNRCIGTRYCANNCPYKVRRFNFLDYHSSGGAYGDIAEVEKMRYNPNVTVRMRGVMEKCTYCVQRIQEAKIKSKRTGQPIKDGDVVTACQQACPADAIVFGDLNDPNSRVARWRASERGYRALAELGTHPRTTYLGKIRNINAEMKEGGA